MYYNQFDNCISTLTRYLALPSALWTEERSAAMRFIASSYQYKGDTGAAKYWLFKAIAECPTVREPYLQMARLGYGLSDWPLVFYMVEQGLSITEKSGSYLLELEAWGLFSLRLRLHRLLPLGPIPKVIRLREACDPNAAQ